MLLWDKKNWKKIWRHNDTLIGLSSWRKIESSSIRVTQNSCPPAVAIAHHCGLTPRRSSFLVCVCISIWTGRYIVGLKKHRSIKNVRLLRGQPPHPTTHTVTVPPLSYLKLPGGMVHCKIAFRKKKEVKTSKEKQSCTILPSGSITSFCYESNDNLLKI
jgi:hypothetical protein